MTPNRPAHIVELQSFRDLSPSVRSFEFRVTDTERFHFAAGQYLALEFILQGRRYTRYFSIASPPHGDARIEICAKRVEGVAGTRFLWAQQTGARVRMSGPYGAFTLRDPQVRSSLFVAAGTGIAPIRSMLLSVLKGRGGPVMTLLFGAREQGEVLYEAEFVELMRHNSNFSYQTILSRPRNGWRGLRGYVQHHVERALRLGAAMEVYISGMKAMVEEVRRILAERGFDRASVHFERHS